MSDLMHWYHLLSGSREDSLWLGLLESGPSFLDGSELAPNDVLGCLDAMLVQKPGLFD